MDGAIEDQATMPDADSRRGAPRLALVLPTLVGGGAERVNLRLARIFLARGFNVDIVVMRAEGELLGLVPEGARLCELGCDRYRFVPRPFARYLRRERPDAVLVNMWPLTVVCALAHRLARSRARLATVDRCAFASSRRQNGLVRWRLLRASLALTCRLADARICVSAGLAEELADLAHFPRDRIDMIYNPVEAPAAGDGGGADVWDGAPGKRILAVGRLVPQKGFALLLEAFARVAERVEARLVILGDGPLRGDLERKVAELGLGARVSLPGFVRDPAAAFEGADLFVLSSSAEGFGNVIVEALACGVPVVSTDCPSGPREILGDGAFGTLVPCGDPDALADAMLAALARAPEPERLMARATEFDPERAADAYLRVLLPGEAADPEKRSAAPARA